MPPDTDPEIWIVIPNRNGRDLLRDCLSSIEAHTDSDSINIVVVDDGSTDGSVPMLKDEFREAHVIINSTQSGVAPAYNRGFEYALDQGADYVLRMDNDMELMTEDWSEKLLDIFECDPTVGAVGCEIVFPDGTVHSSGRFFPLSSDNDHKYSYNRYQLDASPRGYSYVDDVGPLALYSRDVLDSVGLFDEGYAPYWGEESDLYVRIWNAGFKIAYTPSVTFLHNDHTHHEFAERERDPRIEFIVQRNRIRFYLLNYPLSWVVSNTVKQIRGSLSTVVREPQSLLAACLIYGGLLISLPSILIERRKRQNAKELLK